MKTLQDCLSFVRRLESRIPVNSWTLEGIRIWPLVRTMLFYRLTLSLRGSESPPPESGLAARFGRVVDAFLAPTRDSARNLPPAAPAEVFVLSYAAIRQARIDGLFVDIRTGPLIDALASQSIGCHVWEYAVPPPYRFPRKNPTHLVQRAFYGAQFRNRLLGRTMKDVTLPGYGGFCDALKDKSALYPELLEKNLLREFGLILALRDRFERAFDVINPAVAFTSNIGRYEFALNLACRKRLIPTVEMQHGVQGPLHGQYAAWTKAPPEGYELLPHAYWCWDEASASTINEWSRGCGPYHHAVAGGSPWLDYCATLPPAAPDAPRGRRKGLITLQPPEKIYADGRLLPAFVIDALYKVGDGWIWWVRPHPASPCDAAPLADALQRRGIRAEIERVRLAPLPHLLSQADLHLTHSSSAVLEAESFQLGSIVWSELGAGLYANSIENGACRVASDTDSLVQAIRETSGRAAARNAPRTPPYQDTLSEFLALGRRMSAVRRGGPPS